MQIYDDGISLPYEASQSSKEAALNSSFLLILAGAFAPTLNVAADPVSDLRSISALTDVDLSKLSGENVTAVGTPISRLARGMSAQSAYGVRTTVKTTLGLLQRWNPTRHPELRTYLQGKLPSRPGPESFRSLASAPCNPHLLKRPSGCRATLLNYS